MKKIILIGVMISILSISLFFIFYDQEGQSDKRHDETVKQEGGLEGFPMGGEAPPAITPNAIEEQRTVDTSQLLTDTSKFEKDRAARSSGGAKSSRASVTGAFEEKFSMSFQRSYDGKVYGGNKRSTRGNMISVIKGGGSSYRLMEFSRGIGGLLAMYEATGSPAYLEEAVGLSEQVIATAKRGKEIENNPKEFQDDYFGWVNNNPRKRSGGGSHLQEEPLFESYLFRYLAKMVYLINRSSPHSEVSSLRERSQSILDFLVTNGWEKWFNRGEIKSKGCYPYLFRSRTHMTSHWAVVALYLKELTDDERQKERYNAFLMMFDKQLKANLRKSGDSYIWNMTWDHAWPWGTSCNTPSPKSAVQDVSHGNHVVTYIVEAYELGRSVWTDKDIERLVNTAKNLVYNADRNAFNSDLNGNVAANMSNGILTSDGFVKLTRYSRELLDIFKRVKDERYSDGDFNFYEAQYVAELILATKYHTHK